MPVGTAVFMPFVCIQPQGGPGPLDAVVIETGLVDRLQRVSDGAARIMEFQVNAFGECVPGQFRNRWRRRILHGFQSAHRRQRHYDGSRQGNQRSFQYSHGPGSPSKICKKLIMDQCRSGRQELIVRLLAAQQEIGDFPHRAPASRG